MDNQFAADFGVTERWRNKRLNRKCNFYIYMRKLPSLPGAADVWYCDCKDKKINPNIIRPFCSCFHLDIKECNKIDKCV